MTLLRSFITAFLAFFSIGTFSGNIPGSASQIVWSDAPANVFEFGTAEKFKIIHNQLKKDAAYEIFDWHGHSMAKGILKVDATGVNLEPMPCGYYTLKSNAFESAFAVIEKPERINPDGAYAILTAQTPLGNWRPERILMPKDSFKIISELVRLGGFPIVRDHPSWDSHQPRKDLLQWGDFDINANLLHERGIQTLYMFESAPPWTKNKDKSLPDDLFALYEFARRCAADHKDTVTALEFWNEPDLRGRKSDINAWDFAAAQKVTYCGLKKGNPNIKVLMGGLSIHPLLRFDDILFDNGCGDYMDVFNFHIYTPLIKYPTMIADFRKFLNRYGIENMPIWITENGTNAEGNSQIDSYLKDKKEHSPGQDMIQAEFMPKAQILLQSLGIQRVFSFMLIPYNERNGSKTWGMIRWNWTIKPAYVALANLNQRLAWAEYLGTYDLGKGSRGFLYRNTDGTQTLVFWAESQLDTSDSKSISDANNTYEKVISLKTTATNDQLQLYDIFGGKTNIHPQNGVIKVKATRYPSYLTGLKDLSPLLPFQSAKFNKTESIEREIVLRIRLGNGFSSDDKDCASLNETEGALILDVFNFCDTAKLISLQNRGNTLLEGLPATISVAPGMCTSVPLKLRPAVPSLNFQLIIAGSTNGMRISPVSIPVRSIKFLDSLKFKTIDEITNPGRWRKNTSGVTEITRDGNALKVTTSFKGISNKWTYPEFVLKSADESFEGAIAISFEIKADQNDKKNRFEENLLMLCFEKSKEKGESVWLPYPAPSSEWKRVVVPLETKDLNGKTLKEVKMLRIGVNPDKGDNVNFWLRNFKIHY